MNGYFPYVDFHQDFSQVLISVKSVNTSGGAGWVQRGLDHIDQLADSGATVSGKPAELILEVFVQKGGKTAEGISQLRAAAKRAGIRFRVFEFAL